MSMVIVVGCCAIAAHSVFVSRATIARGASAVTTASIPTAIFELSSAADLRARAREAVGVGLLDEAERLLERAVALSPEDSAIWNDLGVVRIRREHTIEGIEAFERGLSLDPDNADLHRNLAAAFDRSGQAAKAIRHYRAFLAAAPTHPDRARVEQRLASDPAKLD
jgi:tetratricopeptide (TPR) repeat protein